MLKPPIPLDLRPTEAEPVDELPGGDAWQYEPKYDGFRCIAHRVGDRVRLQSKRNKPLERYFPEVATSVADVADDGFVLDGEIVIPGGSFEMLQLRLHPAESRIAKLSKENPAELIAFDLLAQYGAPLLDRPLSERRGELERLLQGKSSIRLAMPPPPQARRGRGWDARVSTASWQSASTSPIRPASGP